MNALHVLLFVAFLSYSFGIEDEFFLSGSKSSEEIIIYPTIYNSLSFEENFYDQSKSRWGGNYYLPNNILS